MRKSGTIQYRCRKCGVVYGDMHHPDALMAMICTALGEATNKYGVLGVPAMVSIHSCKDGHSGISDLIGAEYDGDEAEKQKTGGTDG